MTHKKGFTLTEVLLAVMVVALIGVALASLTKAASRESTLGNSKIILRNNLSAALRQIHQDITTATALVSQTPELTNTPETAADQLLLKIKDKDGISIIYCLKPGEMDAAPEWGSGAHSIKSKVGGTIYRLQQESCPSSYSATSLKEKILLPNAKFIPEDKDNSSINEPYNYQVPAFRDLGNGAVSVRLIVEAPGSLPVANVAMDDVFFLP